MKRWWNSLVGFQNVDSIIIVILRPYPFVLDFWKIKLEKSSLTNCTFTACVAYKNQCWNLFFRLKIQFVELDFSNWWIGSSLGSGGLWSFNSGVQNQLWFNWKNECIIVFENCIVLFNMTPKRNWKLHTLQCTVKLGNKELFGRPKIVP